MADKNFFAMINHPNAGFTPLIDADTNDIGKYATMDDAGAAAESSSLGEEYGYAIFDFRVAVSD